MIFRKSNSNIEFIIAGLGNPGLQYENTRHNAGFFAVDEIAAKYHVRADRLKWKALTGEAVIGGHRVLLMKPQTYMNNSGQAVCAAMSFYKIPPERTLLVFDDVSLPPGKVRIRKNGSSGGQNGVKDIIELSGSQEFPRIKIGIGAKPHPDYDLANWVLSKFTPEDKKVIVEAIKKAVEVIPYILDGDIEKAMGMVN